MGLVNKVVPLADLEAEGVQWANEILDMSPTAIRFLKSAFLVATDGLAGLQEFAGNATGLYYTTDEAHEGSTAFLEKRRARLPEVPAPPMSTPTVPSAAPGSTPAAPARPTGYRIWVVAARPATLPAAAAGVAVGLGAALAVGTPFRVDTAIGCLLVALLLQVAANFANDLSDFRRGADTPDRVGPAAGRRRRPRHGTPAGDRDRRRHRARRAGRAVARDDRRLGARGARRARHPRGARVHRRPVPVRLPGAGRGVRVRVLRPRGGRRDGVPPGAAARRRCSSPPRSRPGC